MDGFPNLAVEAIFSHTCAIPVASMAEARDLVSAAKLVAAVGVMVPEGANGP